MTYELIGLPGVGKTTLLERYSSSTNERIDVSFAADRSFLCKSFNIVAGSIYAFRLFCILVYISGKYFSVSRQSGASRNIFLLSERIGHARNQTGLVDEGVFQAVWGLFFRLPLSHEDQLLIISQVVKLYNNNLLYYIALNKNIHLGRYSDRAKLEGIDFFDFHDCRYYNRARQQMSLLLRLLKRSGMKIRIVKFDKNQNWSF